MFSQARTRNEKKNNNNKNSTHTHRVYFYTVNSLYIERFLYIYNVKAMCAPCYQSIHKPPPSTYNYVLNSFFFDKISKHTILMNINAHTYIH